MNERTAPSDCFYSDNDTKRLKFTGSLMARLTDTKAIRKFCATAATGVAFVIYLTCSIADATPGHAAWLPYDADTAHFHNPGYPVAMPGTLSAVDSERTWKEALERIRSSLPPEIEPPMAFSDLTSGRRAGTDANETIEFGEREVPRWLVETILQAAEATDTDPVYLMALADKESGFRWDVKARTSSASGLFQFLSGTWLEMIRQFGRQHNLVTEAESIESRNGKLTVADPKEYRRIMELRNNPYVAALMAAEMLKRDIARIEQKLGRELSRSEFYLAHFLGASSASRLIEAVTLKPASRASRLLPKAARANRTLFVARQGRKARALSVAEFRERIGNMMEDRMEQYEDVESFMVADMGKSS